jgi:superfamily II DNA or RNA helicase
MTLRDQRQLEFADQFITEGGYGILHLCPRFGKIRVAIHIFKALGVKRVLIAYPDYHIAEAWEKEFDELNYRPEEVVFSTYMSLRKHTKELYDIVVLDEIHLMSEAQILDARPLLSNNDVVLGLTGTLSKATKKVMKQALHLGVIANYPIETAIKEGVITDYEITVIQVPLDTIVKKCHKGKVRSEKQQFDAFTFVINKLEDKGGDTKFLRLSRMRLFQNSLAKLNKTKALLEEHPDDRVLVFCGLIDIADNLDIASFHSKSDDDEGFAEFIDGKGNHMAVVRLGNTGLTYKPLNRVIINYFDGNSENLTQKLLRCMSLEYDNPGKIAKIDIITTNEDVELRWLKRGLEFFDKSKITYI